MSPIRGRFENFTSLIERTYMKVLKSTLNTIINKHREISSELGIATAEYAVTTVAACGFAGVLYKLLGSESIAQLIGELLRKALSSFLF